MTALLNEQPLQWSFDQVMYKLLEWRYVILRDEKNSTSTDRMEISSTDMKYDLKNEYFTNGSMEVDM